MTPFAVITDATDGKKYPLADYALTPTVAIVDPELVSHRCPPLLVADSGFDALTHADRGLRVGLRERLHRRAVPARHQADLREHREVGEGRADPADPAIVRAREKMHNASSIAGMAFGNAFLGIVHAMAHITGATFHLIHGRTNATYSCRTSSGTTARSRRS